MLSKCVLTVSFKWQEAKFEPSKAEVSKLGPQELSVGRPVARAPVGMRCCFVKDLLPVSDQI